MLFLLSSTEMKNAREVVREKEHQLKESLLALKKNRMHVSEAGSLSAKKRTPKSFFLFSLRGSSGLALRPVDAHNSTTCDGGGMAKDARVDATRSAERSLTRPGNKNPVRRDLARPRKSVQVRPGLQHCRRGQRQSYLICGCSFFFKKKKKRAKETE